MTTFAEIFLMVMANEREIVQKLRSLEICAGAGG
jgi:hypothetical protein